MNLLELTPVALLSFGGVWVIDFFLTKYTKLSLDTQGKLILGTVLAFVLLFIPVEFQNEFANKVKDAVAVTVGISALYQGLKGIKKA